MEQKEERGVEGRNDHNKWEEIGMIQNTCEIDQSILLS